MTNRDRLNQFTAQPPVKPRFSLRNTLFLYMHVYIYNTLIISETKPAMSNSVAEKRILIAQLAESVLSNPDAAFRSNTNSNDTKREGESAEAAFGKLSKMRMLLELANPMPKILPMNDEHTARLAIVSLLAVFQDILPTYRIRLYV